MMNCANCKISSVKERLKWSFVIMNIMLISTLVIAVFTIPTPVLASEVDDFETGATTETDDSPQKPEEEKHGEHRHRHNDDNDLFDDIFEDLFAGFFKGTVFLLYDGAKMSYARVGGVTDIDPQKVQLRQPGEPTLPSIQADFKYLYLNSELSAQVGGIEFGNGPVGFECRNTAFNETNPEDHLRMTQYHLLLRMSPNRFQEYGIGLGRMELRGNEHNSGFSMTFPIKFYPNRGLGIKYKPTYSWIHGNDITDQDLALVFTNRYGSMELGYRWLEAGGKELEGSYLGFTMHY